jgi:hypothetical protein
MRVNVRPINVRGRAQRTAERKSLKAFLGELKVHERRLEYLGRAVTMAQVIDVTQTVESPLLELFDIGLLWVNGNKLRMRGFEIAEGVQFAQCWDIELLDAAS